MKLSILRVLVSALILTAEIAAGAVLLYRPDTGPAAMNQLGAVPSITPHQAEPAPGHLYDQTARILARPLFSVDRVPAPGPAARPGKRENPPRLTGVVSGPTGKYAIFQAEKTERPVVASAGAIVGQWIVRDIIAGTVTISRDQEYMVLHTTFADAPTDPKPQAFSVANPYFASPPYANETERLSMIARGSHSWSREARISGVPDAPR